MPAAQSASPRYDRNAVPRQTRETLRSVPENMVYCIPASYGVIAFFQSTVPAARRGDRFWRGILRARLPGSFHPSRSAWRECGEPGEAILLAPLWVKW